MTLSSKRIGIMIEITFLQMIIFITTAWVLVRIICNVRNRSFSAKHEPLLLLVYLCLVVIARFVYFELQPLTGYPAPMKIVFSKDYNSFIHLKPFNFISDIYEGQKLNIIGNFVMFIPVGIVWPLCFKKLDGFIKTSVACIGFSLLIELTQLLCEGRHTDIDDLILNSMGAMTGAAVFFIIRKIKNNRKKEG